MTHTERQRMRGQTILPFRGEILQNVAHRHFERMAHISFFFFHEFLHLPALMVLFLFHFFQTQTNI